MQKIFCEEKMFKLLKYYDCKYKNIDQEFIKEYRQKNDKIKKNDKMKAKGMKQ